MKTEIVTAPFTPKAIRITFETQAELDAFGTLCNCTVVGNAIEGMGGRLPDYNELDILGANINSTNELCDLIKTELKLIGRIN